MAHPKLLLLLLLLLAARTGLNLKLSEAESIFSCLNEALSEARKASAEENSLLEKRSSKFSPGEDTSSEDNSEEDKEKRTFPAVTRYKYLAQAQGKGKVYQGQAKSDRRTKFTLSLDVPTNIMNILFDIAKAKNLRAKAAANAHLMAQIGRRK
ncbi:urocortin-3 [Heteronotia binoei]|uniref:urocortin-3 n=1 Tax=Heteronotia binoei TaxID=13085 RepID=UPI00292DBF09|nr:urocortin-3 [Heteronotia binoei]